VTCITGWLPLVRVYSRPEAAPPKLPRTITISLLGTALILLSVAAPALAQTSAPIEVDQSSLTFTAQQGGRNPDPRLVTVFGGEWTAQVVEGAWIRVSLSPYNWLGLVINVSTAGLSAGTYRGSVRVMKMENSLPRFSERTISVTLNVTAAAPAPVLTVDPTVVQFRIHRYNDGRPAFVSPPRDFYISNIGNIAWSITNIGGQGGPSTWLTLSRTSGTGFGVVVASLTAAQPSDGTYTTALLINAPGAGATPGILVIELVVSSGASCTICVKFSDLPPGYECPVAQFPSLIEALTLQSGTTRMALNPLRPEINQWTAAANVGWLAVRTSGQCSAGRCDDLEITPNTAGMSPGAYSATVTVTPSLPCGGHQTDGSKMQVPVRLAVTSAARVVVRTSALSFAASVGRNPEVQVLDIESSTASSVPWTASVIGGNWLSISPAGGTAPARLSVSVNSASLAVGSYSGTITINGPSGTPPATVTVNLTVSQAQGLPEPALTIRLNPGFYIAEVETPPGESGGYWGMEALVPRGLFSGGFNLGGGVQENGRSNTFGAFNLPSTQRVRVRAETVLIPGQDNSRFSIVVRLLKLLGDGSRQVVVSDQVGVSSVEFERTLEAGFYIVEVATAAAAPRGIVLLGISADAFSGGVNVGGFVAPGLVGFGAFYVPEAQDVQLSVKGRPSYGGSAAGSLKLTLRDHPARNVIRTVP
jgi:hypothetical protein